MRFGKLKMFLFLNGFIAIILLLYFGSWLVSKTATASIISPYNTNTIHVQYSVNGKMYTGTHLRSEIPFSQREIQVHYFLFDPSSSRVNSFTGLYAEPLAWWLVFLLASGMLLLMTNTVFSKGTTFQLQKKFPWISMDEYFPAPGGYYQKGQPGNSDARKNLKRLDQNDKSKTLTS